MSIFNDLFSAIMEWLHIKISLWGYSVSLWECVLLDVVLGGMCVVIAHAFFSQE